MRLKALAVMLMALLLAGCSDKTVGEDTGLSSDKCIGSWRLASFCNMPAEFDIYITLRENGTFTLYQRKADCTPVRFSGSYTLDTESGILSGSYDDGPTWADRYIVEDVDRESMIWVNEADKSEVSVYERSEIPASMLEENRKTFL